LISDCATCVTDKNSIFCTEASGGDTDYAANTTTTITIKDKKYGKVGVVAALGPADGAKFCWSGKVTSICLGSDMSGCTPCRVCRHVRLPHE
jgi:hypothetical protein